MTPFGDVGSRGVRAYAARSGQTEEAYLKQLGEPLTPEIAGSALVLRRLLHDHELGLRERFAGSVLLLYAQPLTRIAQLCTSDITMTDRGETAITFARGANVLPEPLASIALALRCQRVADGVQDGWLLPGRKPGTHITAEHLRKRLAVHGITSRPGRHGALLALAGRLPAPILAERLGIHQARAAQWARAAGATYSGYVELRA
jgi:hypothetical protein